MRMADTTHHSGEAPELSTPRQTEPAAARERLFEIALGGVATQMLSVAATLGIADLLADGPKTCPELAQSTATHAPSLLRVLRGLASLGVFSEDEAGRFGLTAHSECLRSDVPGSFRVVPIYLGGEIYTVAGGLLQAVRTGERAFDRTFQASYFEYLGGHPEAARVFNEAMTALGAAAENAAVAAVYDFSGVQSVVDVGGGHGALVADILAANPSVHGILFDQPGVEQSARARLEAAGVADRCTLVGGDFFKGVPAGEDIYVLKRIVHDWDDDKSVALRNPCLLDLETAQSGSPE